MGTAHGKAGPLAPPFADVLGAELTTPAGLDTDRFGTFSGDVRRTRTALQTARAKARLGMDAGRLPYGLASEASYGPLPGSQLPGHEEILVFLDDARGIEVVEGYRTANTPGSAHRLTAPAEVPPALVDGLPGQGLVVRPAAADAAAVMVKGITDPAELEAAIRWVTRHSPDGAALVEPDLRAHHNPSRRSVLTRLATTMAHRLATPCPACAAPGFGHVASEPGLPCRACGARTPQTGAEIHTCAVCSHHRARPVPGGADPLWCPECNP